MKVGVVYDSCDNYADAGNDMCVEIFDKYFKKYNAKFIYPDNRWSVWDMAVVIGDVTYYVENKIKFSGSLFKELFILKSKYEEIREFMEGKDPSKVRFIYMNYFPMIGKAVMYNLTYPKTYRETIDHNTNSTANLCDNKPYESDREMLLLPMGEDSKTFVDVNSNVEVFYANKIWKNGRIVV